MDVSQIVAAVKADGFDTCTPEDVLSVAKYGSVDEGVIGEDYDERLTERIQDELDKIEEAS